MLMDGREGSLVVCSQVGGPKEVHQSFIFGEGGMKDFLVLFPMIVSEVVGVGYRCRRRCRPRPQLFTIR